LKRAKGWGQACAILTKKTESGPVCTMSIKKKGGGKKKKRRESDLKMYSPQGAGPKGNG